MENVRFHFLKSNRKGDNNEQKIDLITTYWWLLTCRL